MKHWQETRAIFDRLSVLRERGVGSALAVVVGIEGSSYRRPGAKLLVDAEGATVGNVSGGCLEEDLKRIAGQVISTGEAQRVHYETGGEEDSMWGFGLGCGGRIDLVVLPVERALDESLAGQIRDLLAGSEAFRLVLRVGEKGPGSVQVAAADAESRADPGGTVFSDLLVPPPTLLVVGAGEDAVPLVKLAMDVGLSVTVVDHRRAYLKALPEGAERVQARAGDTTALSQVPGHAYAVVKTHSFRADSDWVKYLVGTPAPYIGLLGPKARCAEVAASLDPAQRERLYGPVGLDLGAEGPEQVAMSIIAEVLALHRGRTPTHLKDRDRPIHG